MLTILVKSYADIITTCWKLTPAGISPKRRPIRLIPFKRIETATEALAIADAIRINQENFVFFMAFHQSPGLYDLAAYGNVPRVNRLLGNHLPLTFGVVREPTNTLSFSDSVLECKQEDARQLAIVNAVAIGYKVHGDTILSMRDKELVLNSEGAVSEGFFDHYLYRTVGMDDAAGDTARGAASAYEASMNAILAIHPEDKVFGKDSKVEDPTSERVLLLNGEVTEEKVATLIKTLYELDAEEVVTTVPLFINSRSGSYTAALALAEAIARMRTPVNTIGIGEVYGPAVVVLVSGNAEDRGVTMNCGLRLITPPMSAFVPGDSTLIMAKLESDAYIRRLSSSLMIPIEHVEDMLAKVTYQSVTDAVTLNLVDYVI